MSQIRCREMRGGGMVEERCTERELRAHHQWSGDICVPDPWVSGKTSGGGQGKGLGWLQMLSLGRTEMGAGKWSHWAWELSGLQSMRESSGAPRFLNSCDPNLGRQQIQMGRETCENGQQARIRAKQTGRLASSLGGIDSAQPHRGF